MLMAQHQQLYNFQKKAVLIKGKKTPKRSRALETRVAMLEAKQMATAMRAYSQTKSPKLTTETIKPLAEREMIPDRAMQILDNQSH